MEDRRSGKKSERLVDTLPRPTIRFIKSTSANSNTTLTNFGGMKLTLGFSPCPNDTFIFDALVNGKIDTKGFSFDYVMEDVETLNRWAGEGRLDITKLSYSSFLHNVSQYALLYSGSALGKGVGPLLVAKEPLPIDDFQNYSIAIPGIRTTANLLLSLALPAAQNKTELVFSAIEESVLSGAFDAGLIIHESRFTYEAKGLVKLMDLGDWWEATTKAPIPLGGIVIRREIDKEIAAIVDQLIQKSLAYAWKQYPQLSWFVRDNAQEMSEDVMRKHIELYVNEYTRALGTEGVQAVELLFRKAEETGIIHPDKTRSIFY
jgi:1,4-dihydroxy-6-naphthoate synthase